MHWFKKLLVALIRGVKRGLNRPGLRSTGNKPALFMSPNPCQPTDVLTIHLHGLRSCPTQIQVRSSTGKLVLERQVLPLSNHHRQPLTLPRDTPAGMYHCVAVQSTGLSHKVWLALTD